MVSQHFTLIRTLSVAENVTLGMLSGIWFDRAAAEQSVTDTAARYGFRLDPAALVRHLSVGEQQRVEIVKALHRNARVLILDEPTAVLIPQEIRTLFAALRGLVAQGMAVVLISHKMQEVLAVSDRVTVLRDGRVVGQRETRATNQAELASLMVGRETVGVVRPGTAAPATEPVLQLEGVSALSTRGHAALRGLSFTVFGGEILAVAGVAGNGQSELAHVLQGLRRPSQGQITLRGRSLIGLGPAQIVALGVGHIPEDRLAAVVGELSVAENLVLEYLSEFTRSGQLNRAAMRAHAQQLIQQYQIKAAPGDRAQTLSGGNLQKVILARSLHRDPALVVAVNPTRGLDIGATDYVRSRLLEQRQRGAAVLLISDDLDEILALADRIAVIYEGRIVGQVTAAEANPEQLGLLMSGSASGTGSGPLAARTAAQREGSDHAGMAA
jgi:simple sugar transport system ATP-binding protein